MAAQGASLLCNGRVAGMVTAGKILCGVRPHKNVYERRLHGAALLLDAGCENREMGDHRQHLAEHTAIKAMRGRPFSAAYSRPFPWDISGADTKRALRRSFYYIIYFVRILKGSVISCFKRVVNV